MKYKPVLVKSRLQIFLSTALHIVHVKLWNSFETSYLPACVLLWSRNLLCTIAHIWFPIISTSVKPTHHSTLYRFWEKWLAHFWIDLDLWPSEVTWSEQNHFYWRAYSLFMIFYFSWTTSLYFWGILDFKHFRAWLWRCFNPGDHLR